jgi:hypothetical protein
MKASPEQLRGQPALRQFHYWRPLRRLLPLQINKEFTVVRR